RVAPPLDDDRQDLLEIVAEKVRPAERLPRVHPVDVAAQRVDLAVVGDVAVRMRQRPGWEGIGGEALVNEGERGLDSTRARRALRRCVRRVRALRRRGAG